MKRIEGYLPDPFNQTYFRPEISLHLQRVKKDRLNENYANYGLTFGRFSP